MILIVDDHPDSCEPLQKLLVRSGFEAEFALSASEALDKMHETKPELVILDEMMPQMSGLELLDVAKHDPALKDVPVLFLSALPDTHLKYEAMQKGAVGWFVKGRDGWEKVLVGVLNSKIK